MCIYLTIALKNITPASSSSKPEEINASLIAIPSLADFINFIARFISATLSSLSPKKSI